MTKEKDDGDSIINHSYVRRLLSTESTQSNGDDHLTRYGWGTFRPQILQCLSGVKGLLFLISFYVIAQGLIVGGLVNTSLSTIERRYRLSSSQLGLIVTSNDIITGCIFFIITYLVRSRRAKIKLLSAGALILTTGAIIWILPHFMVGLYNYGSLVEKACDPAGDGAGSECDDGQRGLSSYMFMFIAAQVFFGTSSIPLYTFGSDLIEGTAPPNAGGFYLGIFGALAGVGPAIGYMLNGQLLNIYIDFNKPGAVPPSAGPSDARWLGAWWLAVPPFALLPFMVSPWLAGIPSQLPGRAVSINQQVTSKDRPQKPWVTLFREVRSLVGNGTLIGLMLSSLGMSYIGGGMGTFGVKYMESQFALSAGWSAVIVGMIFIPGGILGSLLGGYVMKRFKLGIAGALKMAIILSSSLFVISFAFLLRCDNITMAGVTAPYGSGPNPQTPVYGAAAMTGDCMKNCNCPLAYEPVCGTGGVEFFSPCYAGCRTKPVGDSEEYGSCGCVTHDTTIPVTTPNNFTTVTPGHCASDCKILPFVLAMLTYYAVASAMWGPALTFVALRCVPEDQRSVGLGFQGVIRKLLANIPCPMLFGAFLDKACLMWEESCDERGACLIYDNSKLGLYFFILTFIFSCWAVLGLFGALISWNRRESKIPRAENIQREDEKARNRVSFVLDDESV
ncbi:solute carrier organic anion transporter family member 4C1-like [Branchiostoma floridae]|uniref:Solute carrier organic anion transporter family member n=1 Tax=Branchiostoma floridae TaxID=7739 RepID=A0A9J7LVF6_BRAFL|nr:solute carrier organic anion transporter family member 4C1-like [Branchiostoma floridae]